MGKRMFENMEPHLSPVSLSRSTVLVPKTSVHNELACAVQRLVSQPHWVKSMVACQAVAKLIGGKKYQNHVPKHKPRSKRSL